MQEIRDALKDYVYDTENIETNLKLAALYEARGHLSAAVHYYLRTAERTYDIDLRYRCLIKIIKCFDQQGNRPLVLRLLCENCINLIPSRPEAYFLRSIYLSSQENHEESYRVVNMALKVVNFDNEHMHEISRYQLLLQKAIAAHHSGRVSESKDLFRQLLVLYKKQLQRDRNSFDLVNSHASQFLPEGETNIFKYVFHETYYADLDTDSYIRKTFFPDYFYQGIFVEVGAGPPCFISNSCHFRRNGWRTIAVEPNEKFVKQHLEDGSEVYQYACADYEGDAEFTVNNNNDHWYSEENDGVSFSALSIRHKNLPSHNTQTTIKVKVTTLNKILETAGVETVDVLSIDTEGWELDVLKGFDHNRYQPKIMVLENLENNPQYEAYMNSIGYVKEKNLVYNEVYVRL